MVHNSFYILLDSIQFGRILEGFWHYFSLRNIFKYFIIYFNYSLTLLAMLGLHCCAGFSLVAQGKWGLFSSSARGFLIAMASLAEHQL